MLEYIRNKVLRIGQPQGTVAYTGPPQNFAPWATLTSYDQQAVEEHDVALDGDAPALSADRVNLFTVNGVHDPQVLQRVGTWFGLHPLVQEDIANTGQRPTVHDYPEAAYVVFSAPAQSDRQDSFSFEQISLVWMEHTVLVFQQGKEDCLGSLRQRLRKDKSRLRRSSPDALALAVMDDVIDRYFLSLDSVGRELEELEDRINKRGDKDAVRRCYSLRRDLLALRNALWPIRELLGRIAKGDVGDLTKADRPYLLDVQEHVLSAMDAVNGLYEILAGIIEMHLALENMRLSDVMRVLTIIATIFMPLTFIAGIYGMNFEYMPELKWHYGYFAALGAMVFSGLGMLIFFLRRKWL